MKFKVCILLCILITSCNPKQNDTVISETINTDSILVDNTIESSIDNNDEFDDLDYYANFSYKGIQIFEDRPYGEDDYTKKLLHIMDTIVGLFSVDNRYILKQCRIVKVNTYEQDCGYTVIEPTLETKDTCFYLIRGLKGFNKNDVNIVHHLQNINLWANTSHNFKYSGVNYLLKSEGEVLSSQGEGNDKWEDTANYKLYLISGEKSQCLLKMKSFQDRITELRLVGDLDGDNKPDFIIYSPQGYEDNRLLLFLSSFADKDELVKLVSITFDSFAC